ncbi:hypothetical protein [Parabacteroides goldsteinii]|uniref:hypothetical protein n=1 Tax=Parabacteroides goldsteinii TaxID=328812 RepID=UPI00321BCACB
MSNFIDMKEQFKNALIKIQNNMCTEYQIDKTVENLGVTHIMNIEYKIKHNIRLSDEDKKHNQEIEEEALKMYQKLSYEEKKQKLLYFIQLSYQSCETIIRMLYPKELH